MSAGQKRARADEHRKGIEAVTKRWRKLPVEDRKAAIENLTDEADGQRASAKKLGASPDSARAVPPVRPRLHRHSGDAQGPRGCATMTSPSDLSRPFEDTAIVWTQLGPGVWRASFNHLAIGGYAVHDATVVDSEVVPCPPRIGRVWFGNAKRCDQLEVDDAPPITEASARAWVEAAFREWAKAAVAFALPVVVEPEAVSTCPACGQATEYKSDDTEARRRDDVDWSGGDAGGPW